jgi:CRISPR-associated exonuclease Cas4
VIADQVSAELGDEEPLRPVPIVQGGRIRGILLHKLMEELLNGELEEELEAVTLRARILRDQLASGSSSDNPLDVDELANTALRTLQLPDIKPFRDQLVAEVPIHGVAPADPNHLIAGRADAMAEAQDSGRVVFDWKSDVSPDASERTTYRQQLAQYLHAIGAQRGAVVYMTSGHVDWVLASR